MTARRHSARPAREARPEERAARTRELAALRDDARPPQVPRPPSRARAGGDGGAARATRSPQKVRVDVKEAMALADAAELIARKLRQRRSRWPRACARKGNALLRPQRAPRRRSSTTTRRPRLFAEAGQPHRGRPHPQHVHPAARSCSASTSARRRRRTGRGRSSPREGDELRLARLELNVGNIYHRQDRFAEALRSLRAGLRAAAPRSATRRASRSPSATWPCASSA